MTNRNVSCNIQPSQKRSPLAEMMNITPDIDMMPCMSAKRKLKFEKDAEKGQFTQEQRKRFYPLTRESLELYGEEVANGRYEAECEYEQIKKGKVDRGVVTDYSARRSRWQREQDYWKNLVSLHGFRKVERKDFKEYQTWEIVSIREQAQRAGKLGKKGSTFNKNFKSCLETNHMGFAHSTHFLVLQVETENTEKERELSPSKNNFED